MTSAVINIKVMFSILVVVFSIIISQFSFYFSQYFQVYILTILLVISQSLFPVWHFQGVQQMQYITLCNSIPKIMAAIMVFVLIKQADDTWKVQFIYFCGGVLSLLFSYSILFCKFRFV
ncbi:oligosaccharide flippase family protein, partial [Escherichia coli]|uniref:oligosaccharide flippase family protein n=1 Tax=Escherichia coli TaxID=562 RepID=UPI0035B50D5E